MLGNRSWRATLCATLTTFLLLTSCGPSEQPATEPANVVDDEGRQKSDGNEPATGRADPESDGGPAAPPKATTDPSTAQDDAVDEAKDAAPIATPLDDEPLGQNAFFYLNASVPKLVVEINAVRGAEPTQAAVDLLVQRLESVVDKPRGIEVLPVDVVGTGRDVWSVEQVAKFERTHRDVKSSKDTAVIHISYLDGESSEGALGVAYASSAVAIFAEDLRANALPTVPAVAAEKATLVHEVGHLLALVNITYRSPRDHHDEENQGHSTNVNSVMYHAVDTVGVFTLFRGMNRQPPTDFDADDRADLADLKSGKLP